VLYSELSYAVIGCAMRVHSTLGPGLPEAVYQKALSLELVKAKIPFVSQQEYEVFYEGNLCGKFRSDFTVDEKIIIEIKAAEQLYEQHRLQALTYLKVTGHHLALLINFGEEKLVHKRVIR